MRRFWAIFFIFWPILALWICLKSPDYGWWFPTTTSADGVSENPLGRRIDDLFYMILYVTTIVFIGTQIGLCYVLWTGTKDPEDDVDETGAPRKALFSHGSHNLEVMWTIVPAGILLFIALYQMDVWAEFRVQTQFPDAIAKGVASVGITPDRSLGVPGHGTISHSGNALAEVTARQFEWRIRYPGFDADGNLLPLTLNPQPTDLYDVNELHILSGVPTMIQLKTQDVQHSFFLPELRVKQDAVPGLVIPVWMQADKSTTYSLLCAELCGWGHYKMKARVVAESPEEFLAYLRKLQEEQFDDGVRTESADDEMLAAE
ncbi:MAG: cytochrome c oxidase subunit II transmembrane domain-containing protein [Planctomycetaceae bacterium]